MAEPPSLAGAAQVTAIVPLPYVVTTFVGTPGSARGVIVAVAVLEPPVPAPFTAATVKVYPFPFVSPETVQRSGPDDHEHCCPPGIAVTVYPLIASPPVLTGAVHCTRACVFPAVAETPVGCPGVVRGVTFPEAALTEPEPAAFAATTVNV